MQGKMKSLRKQKPVTGKVFPVIRRVMVLVMKIIRKGGVNTSSMS